MFRPDRLGASRLNDFARLCARGCGLALTALVALTACSGRQTSGWSGYAEGDYVYVSSPLGGQLNSVDVRIGQTVEQGAQLFVLDAESELAAQQEAASRLSAAQAQSRDMDTGKRREEVAVTQAQLEQARVAETLAASDLQRQQQLVAQGFVSKARAEDAATTLKQAHAHVEELAAAMQVGHLPARNEERAAQQASAQAAREVLHQNQWRVQQKQQKAPVAAWVADVFYRPGEFVPAGQPVVSLLPPTNIKARFFVPEADLASLHAGQSVSLSCDGCGAPIAAVVSRISTQPEFTPPVIYSNSQRSKLVFMAEAQPSAQDASRLKPGQPLDVRPATQANGAAR